MNGGLTRRQRLNRSDLADGDTKHLHPSIWVHHQAGARGDHGDRHRLGVAAAEQVRGDDDDHSDDGNGRHTDECAHTAMGHRLQLPSP